DERRDDSVARRAPAGPRRGEAAGRGRPGPEVPRGGREGDDRAAEEELSRPVPGGGGEGGVSELPTGRDLDALVAEKVMGWTAVRKQSIANAMGQHVMDDYVGLPTPGATIPQLVPRYSLMIQEAWKVADHLRERSQFVAVISGLGPQG